MPSQFAVFTLPLCTGSEEEEALNRFLRSCQVIQIQRQFVLVGDLALWSVLIEYRNGPSGEKRTQERTFVDYRDVLSEVEFSRFRMLRELRKTIAESQGYTFHFLKLRTCQGRGVRYEY